jgi:valyl-tRNA synthetase
LDDDLFHRVFPMDLRPQAHEIIRTWLFSSVVRSHYEHGQLPWRSAAISGWILDPDRKKMSKSRGNVVTPADLLREYGSDAVRYWAASARPGTDTAYDTGQMKVGRRLAIKLLNASKFVLGIGDPGAGAVVTEPIDTAMLAVLAETIQAATESFDAFDYARALERAEAFFWNFCDDYLELVKERAYGHGTAAGRGSARAALRVALSAIIRLFAPFLPFVTEETWSWWQDGSVHLAPWPSADEYGADEYSADEYGADEYGAREPGSSIAGADREILAVASDVIAAVRKAKSGARLSMRTEVTSVAITGPAAVLDRVRRAESDLRAAARTTTINLVEAAAPLQVAVTL